MHASASGRVRKYRGGGRRSDRGPPGRAHAIQHRSAVGRTGPGVEAADQSAITTSAKAGRLNYGTRTILPNWRPSARRRWASTPSRSGSTVSTTARRRPAKS